MSATLPRQIGNLGERLAREYLQRKKYTIIESNFHSQLGEIDIIAEKAGWLIFIEVKTQTRSDPRIFGYPEELVDYTKQRKMLATVNKYLDDKDLNPDNWRLDIITVNLNLKTRKAKIIHCENI